MNYLQSLEINCKTHTNMSKTHHSCVYAKTANYTIKSTVYHIILTYIIHMYVYEK